MQVTVRGELFPSDSEAEQLDELMRIQSSCMRYAYNRLCEGKTKSVIEADLKDTFSEINSRYRRGGYFRARANYESAKELVKSGEQESPEKVVFGGREDLKKRERGEISNKDWKRIRNSQLYSRGDKSKGGNLNLRFVERDDQPYLRVNTGNREWIYVPAYLPDHVSEPLSGEEPYGVRILRENGGYELRVSFEENHEPEIGFEKGHVGVDFNQDTIDLAATGEHGQFKGKKTIECSGLTSARRGKREWLIGNYAKEVVDYAKYWNRGITIEKLEDVARGRPNQHEFVHAKFLEAVRRRAEREGVKVREVNPAYTSVIGRWKYSSSHHITSHQASALVIARRGKGIHEKLRGLKTLAFEAMEAGEGEEGVPDRRVHSWSLWSLIGDLPSRKGAEHTDPEPRPRRPPGRVSHRESRGMESPGASAPTSCGPSRATERSSDRGDPPEGKTVIPGGGPPAREATA
ncbi:hypothetical protein AKJ64_01720 [candidate division MSBL1 archaeon SCGC-AAA259E17]|uniref:Transposase n=1 Tax=candidate division MSBL1 archaeon SCGC-AAA259E17 TaxID=1698263 RepID=A0A133UFH5_9EURY|nr:hypothetical protein AKJ64_01720 [candidate division MSBL1 archaeon SCGC-AAA259E17]